MGTVKIRLALAAVAFVLLGAMPAQAGPCMGLGPTVKWSQCPDFPNGFDVLSNDNFRRLAADDFQSDGRPVTDVHWWGSYLWDNPIDRPDAFSIGFWSDRPARPTSPSQPLWLLKSYVIPFSSTHEEFAGDQLRFQRPIHGYQYFADISHDPFLEVANQVYWIAIQALGSETWGWKTSNTQWQDDAVDAMSALAEFFPVGVHWPIQFDEVTDPISGYSVDLAFELTTTAPVPEPATLLLLGSGLAGLGAWARGRRGRTPYPLPPPHGGEDKR